METRDLTFEEYLRGIFETNNGIKNDPDNLVRIHAPELLKLAIQQVRPVISDTDKSNLRDVPAIIRTSNHPFKENLALTLEKYIK